ncbi:MAG TPA: UDP-N-acetylmuramate dehydrogenase [Candidatus Limnocylindria bacterium]|nr:UDP-N-acetylmuramate dehydrogenase [Candidatus Limnocylindria bacterium]
MSATLTSRLGRLDAIAADRGLTLEADAPLAPLTTLRVGGPADRLVAPDSLDDLVRAVEAALDAGVPYFILGKGSDLVVADAGIRGLVIRPRAGEAAIDGTRLRAEAGASMTGLAKRCARDGLAGFDWAISIPGSFGGAIWANAGAHGGEIADVVTEVEVFDPGDRARHRLTRDDCGFGYRESRFKHGAEVVLSGELALGRGDPAEITALVDGHQARRRATQPLADQNAGSVFRNPSGDHAGRLVEAAGLKGHRIGTARVSELHANFIVADRGAGRAADVRALGDHVRATVAQRFGVELEYEIAFVGAWDERVGR